MSDDQPAAKHSIVILGGGFGGVFTAIHLERMTRGRRDLEIVLVSRHNYFLMTPLLFEAGSGVLEPRHAVAPIRKLFRRVRFIQADVKRIDVGARVVHAAAPGAGEELYELPFTQLVIALGGVTNTSVIPGAEGAMTFKVLADAIFLRNHVIELFERADVERDPRVKRKLLNFVIAGAGLVGVELVGELTEFVRNLARSYPRIDEKEIHFELLEGGGHIMPEMDRDLADYAVRVLEKRGVSVRRNSPAKLIEAEKVHLEHETLEASTIIVATGVKPNPLLADVALEKDRKGKLLAESTMQCKGRTDVWAIGDCAMIPDPDGKPYPALAQHALREAKVLAHNVLASMAGQPLKPFVYKTLGTLAALGNFKGIGRVWKFKFKGFAAWWIWRTYYLMQMPRWSRRVRIVLDWTVSLLFKNDIVELDLFGEEHPGERAARERKKAAEPARSEVVTPG